MLSGGKSKQHKAKAIDGGGDDDDDDHYYEVASDTGKEPNGDAFGNYSMLSKMIDKSHLKNIVDKPSNWLSISHHKMVQNEQEGAR